MGEGAMFWEQERLWISCAECGVTVAQFPLKHHMSSKHGIYVSQTRGVDEKGEGLSTYVVSLPMVLQLVRFPVPGCPAVSHSAGRLQEHYMFRYFWSQIAVVQEGMEPLPRCDICGMHIPAGVSSYTSRRQYMTGIR